MLQISRKLHCALAGMKVEAFKTLQEYRRLPVLPAAFKGDKPFVPFETFTLATYNALAEYNRLPRERAADICSAGAAILRARWDDLRETVEQCRLAEKGEIFFGRVLLGYVSKEDRGVKPVIGTLQDIAKEIAAAEKIRGSTAFAIDAISVTRVADAVRNRCREHEINVEQFWAEAFPAGPATKTQPRKKRAAR